MSKRSSVPKEKPKKPLNPYFQFRGDRLKELAGQPGAMKTKTIQEEWNKIPEQEKAALNAAHKKELEKFEPLWKEWIKLHPEDAKENKKKAQKELEEVDEEDEKEKKPKPKGEKAKGAPKARGKKEEEEEVKPEKGKSKGRQQEEEEKVERRGKSKKGKK